MKITLAQLNPTIGDFEGNLQKATEALKEAGKEEAELILFPELFLTGYPPRDLLNRMDFLEQAQQALEQLQSLSRKFEDIGILTGTILPTGKDTGNGLYNSAVLIENGEILFRQHKSLLPNYDVFDEARYFDPAASIDIVKFRGKKLGITICEDGWNDPGSWPRRIYKFDPVEYLAEKGADLIINLSASPFFMGKEKIRFKLIRNHALRHKLPFIMVNQIGGNDELIFDGRSMAVDSSGNALAVLPAFAESVQTIDTVRQDRQTAYQPEPEIGTVHNALILGLKDYFRKCGFKSAVLGLSGGIDSALVCALAAEALGPENVLAISMPSPYSSRGSIDDSVKLTDNLGVELKIIPITPVFESYMKCLQPYFEGRAPDITEENFQARIRGNIVMAFSNKYGHLTLSTGNKSELSVGYCTLYGDMSGGLSVIADVPKTMVYDLSRYINREKEIIPGAIIEKPPSAELKPDQKDQDSLPSYEVLDEILNLYLDEGYSKDEIADRNLDPDIIDWVIRTINRNEFKRRQAAPGLKVTTKAFGMGRRMPLAAKY